MSYQTLSVADFPNTKTHTGKVWKEILVKAQQKMLSGTFHVQDCDDYLTYVMESKTKSDMCFFLYRDHMTMNVFNRAEMREQMIMWRQHALNGKLRIHPSNNHSRVINGRKVYWLVVQACEDGWITDGQPYDSVLMLGCAFMVSGIAYYFLDEKNRDDVYKYVMKNIEEKMIWEFVCKECNKVSLVKECDNDWKKICEKCKTK